MEKQDPSSTISQEYATALSLGRGVHGALAGEEAKGRNQGQLDRAGLEGEQMHPLGDGDVAAAVDRKPGAGGSLSDLAGSLKR